jgi:hypothetical protein
MSNGRTQKTGHYPAYVIRSITRDPDEYPVSLYMAGFPAHTFEHIRKKNTLTLLFAFPVSQ